VYAVHACPSVLFMCMPYMHALLCCVCTQGLDAVLASAGIAVGIASQDVLQNLAAGMYVCRMWRTLPMVVLSIPICLAHRSSVYLFSSTKLHV